MPKIILVGSHRKQKILFIAIRLGRAGDWQGAALGEIKQT
jgi:hypothetical protein